MVVDNFDIVTISIAPNETDPELVIHSNRMLAFAITL